MDAVEEIKSRLSIEDIVGRTVELKRSGANLKGLCPFHAEKTPSFYVSPSRGSYHCFGCGKGGDIFSFVMETERVDFPEALKELAAQAGVTLPEREARKPSVKNRLYEANEAAAKLFTESLLSPQGERARRYLEKRVFGREAIDAFGLGYAPNARDTLVRALGGAGFDDRTLLEAGLALQDDVGGKPRDRFRGRLMFPIRDGSGRITGFGGRALDDDSQPKYLNSPQTEIFDKSSVLFGLHRAAAAIKTAGRAVLVEGYLDAVRAHLGGYLEVVASLGTAVTTQQLRALTRLTSTVVLALDPDPAGQAAATRTALTALEELTKSRGRATGAAGALDLRIARLPAGAGDPDELIRDNPRLWEETIDESVPAFDFYFAQTMDALDRSGDGWRQEAIDRLLPVIQSLSTSAGWQAVWLQRLAAETGVDAQALQRSIPAAPRQSRRAPRETGGREVVSATTSRALSSDPVETMERSLLALLLKIMIVPDDASTHLRDVELSRPEHRRLLSAILAWRSSQNYDYDIFREDLDDDLAAYADDLRTENAPLPDDGRISVAVDLHLARIRYAQLDAQFKRATSMAHDIAPEDRDTVFLNLAHLMSERQSVDQRLDHLSEQTIRSQG